MGSFDATAHPDRLNLGCGFDVREGYLNVDLHAWHHPDLVADVTDLHMLPDGRYVEVLAQDVLEHLPRPSTPAVLSEWHRTMADGGLLHLRVPSLFDLVALMQDPEFDHRNGHERFMQSLYGTQAYTGDFHTAGFTRPLLEGYLADEGFEVVEWSLLDRWLFEVTARKVGPSQYAERLAPHAGLLTDTDPVALVDKAYRELLGREVDPEGAHYWAERLRGGSITAAGFVLTLAAGE